MHGGCHAIGAGLQWPKLAIDKDRTAVLHQAKVDSDDGAGSGLTSKRRKKAHLRHTVIQSGMLSWALRFGLDEDAHSAIAALLHCIRRATSPLIVLQVRLIVPCCRCRSKEQPGSESDGCRLFVRIASRRPDGCISDALLRVSGRCRSDTCPPVVLVHDLEQLQSDIDEALCLVSQPAAA